MGYHHVSGPSIWNNLPGTVTSAQLLLSTFHQPIKTYLFSLSLSLSLSLSPSWTLYWTDRPYLTDSGSWSNFYYLDHSKLFE